MNLFPNTTSNFSVNPNFNSPETPYPQALPLSYKEKTNLKWSNIAVTIFCVALWVKALVDVPQWYTGIEAGFTRAQESITSMLLYFFIVIVCLLCFVAAVGITYVVIKNGFDDSKGGIKHTGMAEFISKNLSVGSEASNASYYVILKWANNPAEETIELDHFELFGKLMKGNRVYLELLPNSKKVLRYQIV